MSGKASSLSEKLLELSDPRPTEFHPDEDDWDLLTGAKISRAHSEEAEVGVAPVRSRGRARLLAEEDPRYGGKPVSRRQLQRGGRRRRRGEGGAIKIQSGAKFGPEGALLLLILFHL